MTEHSIQFAANTNQLSAMLHTGNATTGVLVVVGGPQYRVGSHRQFVKLSRFLADNDVPSMRLDTAGMGDSDGNRAAFYQQSDDITQAINVFFQRMPLLKKVVLWGLCDAASAILIALNKPDPRISAVVLLNPWVRQQHSHAQALLKHYYLKRLVQRSFWRKLFSGSLSALSSLRDLCVTLQAAKPVVSADNFATEVNTHNYIAVMLSGAQAFTGATKIITSGNDLTAQEFLDLCHQNPAWAGVLAKSFHSHIAAADHTFSTAKWRQQTEQLTLQLVTDLTSKQDKYEKSSG